LKNLDVGYLIDHRAFVSALASAYRSVDNFIWVRLRVPSVTGNYQIVLTQGLNVAGFLFNDLEASGEIHWQLDTGATGRPTATSKSWQRLDLTYRHFAYDQSKKRRKRTFRSRAAGPQ